MIVSFVFSMLALFSILMSVTIYPIALGGFILLMSIFLFFIISLKFSALFGVILLLVFVGGMLVAFGYAVALAPNPVFSVSNFWSENQGVARYFVFMGVFFCFFCLFMSAKIYLFYDLNFMEMSFQGLSFFMVSDSWNVILIFSGVLLLVCMIGVVSLCLNYKGALIQFSRSLE